MDNDEYGHMNNATYLSLTDTAVSLWQIENGLAIRGPGALRFLVVETRLIYFAETGFPDTIHAGLRCARLGTSSVALEVGLFANDAPQTCTLAHFAQVLTDTEGRPTPIPEHVRRIYQSLPGAG
ncbi:thioesterase family protein [Cognatishimia sp. F0-27]|uniref:acyl-CoA thioesterase n=1 Tax=Cognatishimia sp. F0-27 TaxID=2816855 RepID=UPI0021074994|nr:thioesterase family protein [Cognatishimia sp. F0-27]